MTINSVPFKHIGMDLITPLPKSARDQEHVLASCWICHPKHQCGPTSEDHHQNHKLRAHAPLQPRWNPQGNTNGSRYVHYVTSHGQSVLSVAGGDLTLSQKQDLTELMDQYADVFFSFPGLTHLIHHKIKMPYQVGGKAAAVLCPWSPPSGHRSSSMPNYRKVSLRSLPAPGLAPWNSFWLCLSPMEACAFDRYSTVWRVPHSLGGWLFGEIGESQVHLCARLNLRQCDGLRRQSRHRKSLNHWPSPPQLQSSSRLQPPLPGPPGHIRDRIRGHPKSLNGISTWSCTSVQNGNGDA